MRNADPALKARRQRDVLDLVRAERFASQVDLVRALRRRGHRVTQATLSRDLHDLRVTRLPTEEGYRYGLPGEGEPTPNGTGAVEAARLRRVAVLEVTGIDSNEAAVVVRTLTGRAQGVAVCIDGLGDADILGTLAGDDTVLVLPRSTKDTARVRRNLARTLGLN